MSHTRDTGAPDLSVVVCSLNGADGVRRCLESLAGQRTAARIETIVVDDGSADPTSEVAEQAGAIVIRHERNRGLAASRNDGVRRAGAEVVAFLDDDCEADPHWADRLLAIYEDEAVVGAGGAVRPLVQPGYPGAFLERNNPLAPLELDLADSNALPYRLALYLRAQWAVDGRTDRRAVSSLVGANMSFRRSALVEVGLFDERFTFGAEELDLCWRITARFPDGRLVVDPAALVGHRFTPGLSDTLRRARAYGRGTARLYRKWPSMNLTVYPWPLIAGALGLAALRRPRLAELLATWPLLAYPSAVRHALRAHSPLPLLDAYVRLAQEHRTNVGYAAGLWEFRDLQPDPPSGSAPGAAPQRIAETIM